MVGLMFPALGTSYSFSSAFTFFPRFHTIPAHSPYPRAFPLFPRFHIFPALFHSRAFSLSPRFPIIHALSPYLRAFLALSPYSRALPRFHLIPALSHYSHAVTLSPRFHIIIPALGTTRPFTWLAFLPFSLCLTFFT